MNTFTFNNQFGDRDLVTVFLFTYENGRKGIQIHDAEDGMPYMTASVNVPGAPLSDDEVIIKDYSENAGILDFLVDNNICTKLNREVQVGYTMCSVCHLLPESQWGIKTTSDPLPVDYNTNGKKKWVIDGYNIWADNYQDALSYYAVIKNL